MLIGQVPVIVYLVLLAAIVLLLVRRHGVMRGVSRRVTRSVWCPVRDRGMTATLQEDFWDGTRVEVEECSAFSPATAVTCEKACLRLTERPRAASASRVPLLF
jgi:hypothetical protein